jgi:hypothetical protein
MGKTVESFRIALEGEINRWNGFARALRKPDREAFDELMDMCRSYASAAAQLTPLLLSHGDVYNFSSLEKVDDADSGRLYHIGNECKYPITMTMANIPNSTRGLSALISLPLLLRLKKGKMMFWFCSLMRVF